MGNEIARKPKVAKGRGLPKVSPPPPKAAKRRMFLVFEGERYELK